MTMVTIRERRMPAAVGTTTARTGPELRLLTDAITENLRRMRTGGPVMAVVKADGYGHGAVAVAGAAVRAGAEWLGVTDIAEAVPLRAAGLDVPMLAWLHPSGIDAASAAELRVDVAVGSVEQLTGVIDSGRGCACTCSSTPGWRGAAARCRSGPSWSPSPDEDRMPAASAWSERWGTCPAETRRTPPRTPRGSRTCAMRATR